MTSRFLALHHRGWLAGCALLVAGVTGAAAQNRCEGTLCDFYYDHMAQPQQKPTAPAARPSAPAPANESQLGRLFGGSTSQPQPSAAAPPAKKPLVGIQGGGVIGLMHGEAPQRCTGTLCDLFYGGPPPEEPAARSAPTSPVAATRDATTEGVPDADLPAEAVAPREPVPGCVAGAGDPWRCYR